MPDTSRSKWICRVIDDSMKKALGIILMQNKLLTMYKS